MNKSGRMCYAPAKAGVDGFDKLRLKRQMVAQRATF
jgi:hypothetical protein